MTGIKGEQKPKNHLKIYMKVTRWGGTLSIGECDCPASRGPVAANHHNPKSSKTQLINTKSRKSCHNHKSNTYKTTKNRLQESEQNHKQSA